MELSSPQSPRPRRRVAFVVQRYGVEIDGGSEALCRAVAERLAAVADVEVLTTTAVDYLTWKSELPEGLSTVGGVAVRRFAAASRRRVRSFGRLSERLYRSPHSIEEELDWMVRQGPRALGLLEHLRGARGDYDAVVFFTYLYYTTYFGLPLVAEKSVLVPTLHDEPPAHFEIFRALFQLPRALVWNTPEEAALAARLFPLRATGEVAGLGVEAAADMPAPGFAARHGLGEYVLYLGRLDVWKGVPELLELFKRYRAECAPALSLVLAGKAHMAIPRQPGVVTVGYLSAEEKRSALAAAAALVVPSSFESLSVVALESWGEGVPVLANARAEAVAGQCARAQGGLSYGGYEQFRAGLDCLRSAQGKALGAAGREFVRRECTWERVLGVYRRAIERAAAGGAE